MPGKLPPCPTAPAGPLCHCSASGPLVGVLLLLLSLPAFKMAECLSNLQNQLQHVSTWHVWLPSGPHEDLMPACKQRHDNNHWLNEEGSSSSISVIKASNLLTILHIVKKLLPHASKLTIEAGDSATTHIQSPQAAAAQQWGRQPLLLWPLLTDSDCWKCLALLHGQPTKLSPCHHAELQTRSMQDGCAVCHLASSHGLARRADMQALTAALRSRY